MLNPASFARVSPLIVEALGQLRSSVESLAGALNLALLAAVGHSSIASTRSEVAMPPEILRGPLSLILQATGASAHTLAALTVAAGMHTRDCFGVARTILEGCVNLAYLLAEGESAAKQSIDHAKQKSFRDLARESKIGDQVFRLEHTGAPDVSSVPGLADALAAFTRKNGTERTDWCDLNIDARIGVVQRSLGHCVSNPLQSARFMIYRHSSEILHGTYFGALFFLGGTELRDSHDVSCYHNRVGQLHVSVVLAAVLAMTGVVRAFDKKYGYAHIVAMAHCEIERIRRLALFAESSDGLDDAAIS